MRLGEFMVGTLPCGGRLRPAALLATAALALGLVPGGAEAATCNASSVTTDSGIAALGCGTERPFEKMFDDKIDDIDKGNYLGEVFSIAITRTKDRNEAIAGTWSLLPGLSFEKGASYALALKGGKTTLFYALDTSANSGTWSTADLLVGAKDRQAALSNLSLYGTKAPAAAPVPLPAAAWLLVGGMVGLGAIARRRRPA